MGVGKLYEVGKSLMSDVRKQNEFKPFTHSLSGVLSVIAIIYLISNITFMVYCVPVLYNSTDSAVCKNPGIFRSLDNVIPAIWRPVNVFEQAGNYKQANIVRNVYEFSWGSALFFCVIMMLIALVWLAVLSGDAKRKNNIYWAAKRRSAKPEERAAAKRGIIALLGIELILFIDAFYGDHSFDKIRPFADRVYVLASDFSCTSIELFLLLLGVVVGITVCAKVFALKGGEKEV